MNDPRTQPTPRRSGRDRGLPGQETAPVDPIRAYLEQAARVALLTREGELELARRRDRGQAVARGLALVGLGAGKVLADAVEVERPEPEHEHEHARHRRLLRLDRLRRAAELHRRARARVNAHDWDGAGELGDQLCALACQLPLSEEVWILLEAELDATLDAGIRTGDITLEQRLGHHRARWPKLRAAIDVGRCESRRARAELVEANLRLVIAVARRYGHHGLPLLDLIQEGNLGLMRAAEKFDPSRGFRFSTYAIWWIRQSVTRSLADHGRTIRLPVHVVETLGKLNRVRREFIARLGRDPTPEELGERLGVPATRVRFLLTLGTDPASLETPIGEDGELGDLLEDEGAVDPLDTIADRERDANLRHVLAQLSTREQRVLRLRFGFEADGEQTLEVVGREFALTRERVRQIEAKALQKLRRPSLRVQIDG